MISVVDDKLAPNISHAITYGLGLAMEIAFLAASLDVYTSEHNYPPSDGHSDEARRASIDSWEGLEVAVDVVRVSLLFGLVFMYSLAVIVQHRRRGSAEPGFPDEFAELLGSHGANGNAYGGIETQKEGWVRLDKLPSKSWWEYICGYSLFFPYLWPAKSVQLQLTAMVCFLLVVAARVVNVLVPWQVGEITDYLAGDKPYDGTPWWPIVILIFLRLLQGSSGLLGAVRAALWVPIGQYSFRELSVAAFEHVHGLSLDFHLGKKTGEVLSALNKGSSINTFLEQVTFQVLPMLVDLAVAIGYFFVKFDEYYALVIAIVTFVYLYITVRLAQWRADIRRDMVNSDRQQEAVKNDSMVSYETVKYFNAEAYEFNRYRDAVRTYQKYEAKVLISLNVMNVSQNTVFMSGLLVTCFISAYQVTTGQQSVGKFTSLLTYMAQLQQPLNFFGTFYRSIQSAMINSERMLELFKEQPSVIDEPGSFDITSCQGSIRFSDVEFAYDSRKQALRGVSFSCEPGTTTALVGESGGGKSTMFRLLFRFYNAESGSIQIDGHDVQDITIDSLRRQMGVVPQDTVLFNESIMYNLKYAKPEASDEDVYNACRAASIHERITSFPDGYNARVGERGLKLSGGEKQRIAIARTILKDPRIILLDEATAALDTETEQNIQEALQQLSQGRTTVVIAHRLSTITTADQIIVLHAGRVAERGTHQELLEQKGRYASMWRRQIRAQKAAEQAKIMTDRAEALKQEAHGADSASQSEDERGSSGEGSRPASRTGADTANHAHGLPSSHP